MSKRAEFGEALANYSLAAVAGGLVLIVFSLLLVPIAPGVVASVLMFGNAVMAFTGAFVGVMIYLGYNLSHDRYELETGLEIFAALLPFGISPVIGVIVGVMISKLG